jgi:hypothetical protein
MSVRGRGERAHEPGRVSPGSSGDVAVFIHIGKTAGSSMNAVLTRQYGRGERLLVRPPRWEESLASFAELPQDQRGRARLIHGHLTFGIHEMVERPVTYFSLVRRPVARAVSLYTYVLRNPSHRLHGIVTAGDMSLLDYVESGVTCEVDNGQTRILAGDTSSPFGGLSEAVLDQAKANIEGHFAAVGLTERFDETLLMLKHQLGWKRLHSYPRMNVAPRSARRGTQSDRVLEAIRRRNWLDEQLYEYVEDRFRSWIASQEHFEQELAHFRRRMAWYRPWGYVTRTAPRRVRSKCAELARG